MNANSLLNPAGPKAPVNKLWWLLGALMAIVTVVGSLYLALWLCFIGGIVQVVKAVKATPVSSMGLALGVLRFLSTALVGWGCFILSAALMSFCFARAYAGRNKQKLDHLIKTHDEFFGKR